MRHNTKVWDYLHMLIKMWFVVNYKCNSQMLNEFCFRNINNLTIFVR